MQLRRLPRDSWRKTNLSHNISSYHSNAISAALLETVRLPVWRFSRVEYTRMESELLRDDDLQFDYEKQHFGD
jgi:hypothetical protein